MGYPIFYLEIASDGAYSIFDAKTGRHLKDIKGDVISAHLLGSVFFVLLKTGMVEIYDFRNGKLLNRGRINSRLLVG